MKLKHPCPTGMRETVFKDPCLPVEEVKEAGRVRVVKHTEPVRIFKLSASVKDMSSALEPASRHPVAVDFLDEPFEVFAGETRQTESRMLGISSLFGHLRVSHQSVMFGVLKPKGKMKMEG